VSALGAGSVTLPRMGGWERQVNARGQGQREPMAGLELGSIPADLAKPLEQQLFDDIVGLLGRARATSAGADADEIRGEADRLWARLARLLEQTGRGVAGVQAMRDRIRHAVAEQRRLSR